jgi:tRNA pseudouridine55 synthase
MNGILLVDKPSGWTSFDVVNYVRKMARQAALVESYKVESKKAAEPLDFKNFQLSTPLPKVKVGHTGTLDPMATGLLVLLIGKEYTRRAGEFSKLDKTYEVVARLGQTSTTGDEEGEKTAVSDTTPSEEAIRGALRRFCGQIEQLPPQYSAIKINGQRAYDLARKGKIAEIEPRTVRIDRIELTKYEYPDVSFVCDVSSGTYIRSLVEDIGKALGTGAYTAQLRRTRVGKFDLQNATQIESLNRDNLTGHILTI